MNNPKTITIFGSSRPEEATPDYQRAYDLGYALTEAGFRIINGGYGGTMTASAQGAHEAARKSRAKVTITGVTCDAFGRPRANPWINNEIRTENLLRRLEILLESADAYIILPGSTGTLLELAAIWELVNKHFITDVPIICVSSYWKPVVDTIVRAGEADGNAITFLDSPPEVVEYLCRYFEKICPSKQTTE